MANTTVLKYRDIINMAKELNDNIEDITSTLKRLRNGSGRDFIEEARRDERYSIKILIKEYDRLTGNLHSLESTEINECHHKVDESTSTATGDTIGVGTEDKTNIKTTDIGIGTDGDDTINTK